MAVGYILIIVLHTTYWKLAKAIELSILWAINLILGLDLELKCWDGWDQIRRLKAETAESLRLNEMSKILSGILLLLYKLYWLSRLIGEEARFLFRTSLNLKKTGLGQISHFRFFKHRVTGTAFDHRMTSSLQIVEKILKYSSSYDTHKAKTIKNRTYVYLFSI